MKAIATQPKPKQDIENARRHLEAQEQMAKWSKLMNTATWLTASIAIVGVVSVWWDVFSNRKIGRAQTRAYLWIKSPQFEFFEIDGEKRCTAWFYLNNTGNSPAKITRCSCMVGITKKDSREDMIAATISQLVSSNNGYVPAGSDVPINTSNSLSADQIASWKSGDYEAVIFSKVLFEDIYDTKFGMETCFRCIYVDEETTKSRLYANHTKPQYLV